MSSSHDRYHKICLTVMQNKIHGILQKMRRKSGVLYTIWRKDTTYCNNEGSTAQVETPKRRNSRGHPMFALTEKLSVKAVPCG